MVSTESIAAVKAAINDLIENSHDQRLNLQEMAADPASCAKVQMGLAFTVTSLFYSKSLQLLESFP